MNGIRDYRIQHNLSQVDLARIVGVERSTVSKWETGEAKPRADMLVKLAKALNCKVDDFLRIET